MRILTRKLWRAFPELDRFEDERARRLLSAAAGSGSRRLGRFMVVVVIGTIAAAVPWGLVLWFQSGSRSLYDDFMWPLWPLFASFPAPVIAYVARDLLLRFRVRTVLRPRCECSACGYSLAGITVPANLRIQCPECGGLTELSSVLMELVEGDTGTKHLSASPAPALPPLVSARARRVGRRSLIVILVAFVLLSVSYEVFLRRQAAAAAANDPGMKGWNELVRTRQPGDASAAGTDDAWQSLLDAYELHNQIQARALKATTLSDPTGSALYAAYWSLPDQWHDVDPDSNRINAAFTLELLARHHAEGMYTAIQRLSLQRGTSSHLLPPTGAPLVVGQLAGHRAGRTLGDMNAARMRFALAAGDLREFAEAFEGSLAIARITRVHPTLLFWLEACQIETQALQHARAALIRHPSWHEHLACAATRQLDDADVIYAFQGEQIFDANLLAWVFVDPKNVRFGFDGAMLERLSRWLGSATPRTEFSLAERWPGSYSGAIAASRAHWEEWSAFAKLPTWKRGALPDWYDRPRSIMSAWTMMVPRSAVAAADHLHASRAAFTIMVALEQYRDTHGRYPESLQSLVPSVLDSVPPDPFTGDSPRYFLIDPATDEHGRGYLAYYVGPGGTNNLGAMPDDVSWRGLFDGYYFDAKAVRGIDLLFNDPR